MVTYAYRKTRGRQQINGGATLTFEVWKIVRNVPKYFGLTKANAASYRGDESTVARYIARREGYKLTKDGYDIVRQDVRLIKI